MNIDSNLSRIFKAVLFKTSDTTVQIPRIDASTHAINTLSHGHHEVHAGRYFRSGMNFTLANGNVATFGMITPMVREIHITWALEASADGTFDILEDVTSFSGGVSITPINHNRGSSNTSGAICTKGMTGADIITPTGGTTLLSSSLATGKGVSIERGLNEEFILKKNTKYLFRYTNGTSSNVIKLALEWYEHERREA